MTDRDRLIELIYEWEKLDHDITPSNYDSDKRPLSEVWVTVIAQNGEKVYGKLHDKIENNPVGYCSVCNKRLDDTFMNYCPNCGAKMDGERKVSE